MRVVAGRFGRRRLVAPRGLSTRPTGDRVREALFSALGDVRGARVLDLYAGTGALGIEALSRGAESALFVESARDALAALKENLDTLGLGPKEARVLAVRVERAQAEIARSGPFDLILIDPPYAEVAAVAASLGKTLASAAAGGARLVLEHATRDRAPAIASFEPSPSRTYGDTSITIYQREV